MALLATQSIVRNQTTNISFSAAGASDTFVPDSRTFLYYKTTGTVSTLTFVTPREVAGASGVPMTDYTVALSATADRAIGPFPADIFADPSTGLATVTSSSQTGLTVACVQLSV
jgi:hypothetical protein